MTIVALYLSAVVAANLIVTALGPGASVVTAFALIGFNITARDRLHDAWRGRGLRWKMAALIATGGVLSWLVNADAARIAMASSAAFAISETVDAIVYHAARRLRWFGRVNASNVASSAVDSVLFPALAFGAFLPWVVLGQFLAKTVGGALWAWALRPRRRQGVPVLPPAAVHPHCRYVILPLAALAAMAGPADGQIVSVGPAVVATEYGADPALELFVAGPPFLGIRPNAVASWSADRPAYLAKLSAELLRDGPAFVSAELGASFLAFRGYDPEPLAGLFASSPLPVPRTALAGAFSVEPWNRWSWTAVLKVDVLVLFRR